MNLNPFQDVGALKSDLGGSPEKSYLTPTTLDGSGEVQDVLIAATASAAQGDYFILTKPNGSTVAGWIDIDANGTQPTGPAYLATTTQVRIGIVTGGTAAQNGAIMATAFAASPQGWTPTDLLNGHVKFTQQFRGDASAPARHNTGDTGNGSFTVATTTAGVAPTLQGKYFTFSNTTTAFYGYFTNAGNGSDPAPGGTGRVIALLGNETQSSFLSKIATVIDTTTGMTAEADGSRIGVRVDGVGPATDLAAGNSGFSVAIAVQGNTRYVGPELNLADDSPVPDVIT